MDSRRWQRIQSIFHAAVELPEAGQQAFVERECGGDRELQAEIEAMLKKDSQGEALLGEALPHLADELLSGARHPLPFEEFGNYRIVRKLGEGGMGVVYLAERKDLRNRVAIKFLRDMWLSPSSKERFDYEQKTLAKLNHPNIARIYDAGALPDGSPWFAMEYVEGARLTDYCRERHYSIAERLRLFRAVCDAVQYAHGQSIIHRDLKPSNILVTEDGTPKLLDFGIAKQAEDLGVAETLTATGLRLMTTAYASPEQVRGESVATSTDIYSLGVVLYELLAGRLPFDVSKCSPAAAERLITEQEPQKPSAAALESPPGAGAPRAGKSAWSDLDLLCLTALHKDPRRRYPTVDALIRDIDRFIKGEPLDARPDDLRYTIGKFVKRNRRSVIVAAGVLAALIGLAVFDNVRLRRARDAAQAESARTLRVEKLLTDIFQGGDEQAGPSKDVKVVDLLDRGVKVAQSRNDDPAIQADLFETLGSVYQALGDLEKAQRLIESAFEKRKLLFGENSTEVAKSLLMLGLLRIDQNRSDDAQRLTDKALELYKRLRPPGDPAIAEATIALGRALEAQRNYPRALQVFTEADRLLSAPHSDPSIHGSCLLELANIHFYMQHWDESEALDRRALEIWRGLYGPRHPFVADALINLGNVEINRGKDYAAAERDYREALDINQAWHGKDHPETAADMGYVANALVYEGGEGRYREAEGLAQEAVHILDGVSPGESTLAVAIGQWGAAEVKLGKLDAAEAHLRRSLEMYRKLYTEHALIGTALSNLGEVYTLKKQYARAEGALRGAIRQFARTGQPEHAGAGIAHIRLGRTLLRERRYQEAEGSLLTGYQIVAKVSDSSVNALMDAREDLIAVYDGLHTPEKSAKFRTELDALRAQAKAPTRR
ncbi:MAG: serine/threonine-protein kinase [Bryobacteraceae bacterium]|jgi:serine/threonine-protein kinase